MIDTHCHLTYGGLYERVDEVAAAAAADGVDRMITIGTAPDDARKAVALAERFSAPGEGQAQLFAGVGLHPHYSHQWSDRAMVVETLQEFAPHPRVVAFGEMGLDRHYPLPPIDVQRKAFEWQLQAITDLPALKPQVSSLKPIVIHNREATDDTLAMLRASGLPAGRFVFHCFTGSDAELDAILAFGAMVSFTGIATFKNARTLAASASRVPLDRIMLETDSPYLTPEPYRKVKINEPRYVTATARFLAGLRGMNEADFIAAADGNAKRFFGV